MDSHHSQCLLCSSTKLVDMREYENASLCRCSNCGFIFSRKIPSQEELQDLYQNHYGRTTYISPITVKRYEELLNKFEKYRKHNRILDIGAGCGFFLEIAKQRGWDVYGTEFTDDAMKICADKGIEMSKGELHSIGYESEFFDVIISIEVLEHLYNPHQHVTEIQRILRKGGITYITTPNFNALLRYRLKANYNIIEYPLHLCYYTSKTLRKLFVERGFITEKITTTGYSVTRLRTSKGKSNQEYVSETSDDEMMRYRIEQNWLLGLFKRILNWKLNLFKVGDSLKGAFVKK